MIPLINKPNITGSDTEYPFGNIRDRNGAIVGTPGNVEVYADIHQFFEKLIFESDVTANDLPDNEYNGWQLWEAMQDRINNEREYNRFYVKMSQSGTEAPTFDRQIKNDFGTSPALAYIGVGIYDLTFGSSVFGADTTKLAKWAEINSEGSTTWIRITSGTVARLNTYNGAGTLANDILDETTIMIRVYP